MINHKYRKRITCFNDLTTEEKPRFLAEAKKWEDEQFEIEAQKIPLTDDEKLTVKERSKIHAIFQLQKRVGCNINIAKKAVERYYRLYLAE